MTPEKRHKVLATIGLPPVTENTITGPDVLEDEIRRIQEKGYAFEDQELRDGVRRLVAPIYDHENCLAGCVGVAATIFSLEMNQKEDLAAQVIETAERISNGMGRLK
jgi:IclR family KDG regulon transcriptional repressor